MKMKPALIMMLLATIPMSHALTVEESAAQAIRTQPQLLSKYARYESVYSETQGAKGDYLPQVSLRAGMGSEKTWYNTGKKTDTQLTRQDGNLRVTQKVFDGFRTPANVARLKFETESERMGLISAAENMLLDVTAAYLEVRKQEEIVALATRNITDHEQVLVDIQNQLAQGYASESDIAQVVSRLANARSSLVAANNNLADSKSRYKRLVGTSPEQLSTPQFDAKLIPSNQAAAQALALEKHPELKAAQADIEASNEEIRVNQAGFYPQVNVEAEYNRDKNHGGFEGRDENGRVMLMLNYDIFNGGRDYHRAEASAWRHQEARSISQKAQRDVLEGTELSWNAFQSLAEQLGYLQQSVDAATAAEAGYTQQYKLGRRTLLDVLNAKIEVFVARRNYLSSLYDHKQAAYRVLNATGQLSYALRVDLPSQFALKD